MSSLCFVIFSAWILKAFCLLGCTQIFTRYQEHILHLKKKLGQVVYMLNINTNLHFNLYFLHWSDTSLLFIVLRRIFRHASEKTSKSSNVLRFRKRSSQNHINEFRNLKSSDIWRGIYRGEKFPWHGRARNCCNLCVYFRLQRYLPYSRH